MAFRNLVNRAQSSATRVAASAASAAATTAVAGAMANKQQEKAEAEAAAQAPPPPPPPGAAAAPASVLSQVGTGPVASATGALEPIAGITLERYAELAAKMADCNGDLEVCAQ